jgi:hypothetical protein
MLFLDVQKRFRVPSNSAKLVMLFTFLKEHEFARNEDISRHLGYAHGSSTSHFLGGVTWIEKKGRGATASWRLAREYA